MKNLIKHYNLQAENEHIPSAKETIEYFRSMFEKILIKIFGS